MLHLHLLIYKMKNLLEGEMSTGVTTHQVATPEATE